MKTLFHLAVIAVCLASPAARAVDLQQFVDQIYRYQHKEREVVMVYWLPAEYYDEALRDSPDMSDEDRKALVKTLKNYTLFAIAWVHVNSTGTQPWPRDEIAKTLDLHQNGDSFQPIEYADMPEDLQNVVGILRPGIVKMFGDSGRGVEIFVYPNTNVDKRILDPREKGSLKLHVYEMDFEWKTPLPILFPPKIDPKTGESFPGTYNFNPYTGDKLPAAATNKPSAK